MNISVATLPNGYSLKCDGQYQDGYMYFDPETLVAGMLKHVVLGDKSEQEPELCRNLMQSMMTWPETSELHAANAKLLSDIEDAHRTTLRVNRSLSSINKRYDAVCVENRELKEKLAAALTRLDNYDRERRIAEKQAEIERVRAQRKQTKLDIEAERSAKRIKVKPSDEDNEVVKKIKSERMEKLKAAKKAAQEAEKPKEEPTPKPKPKAADKPKKTPKAKTKAVKYSEAVYQALMTPLTIDRMHGISLRTLKILKYAGGQVNMTVGDAARYSKKEMLMQRGCGTAVIDDWQRWLDAHGLQMGMNVSAILKQHEDK